MEHSNGSKITVIISADKRKPTLDALLRSLQRHGFSYRIVGMGKPWAGFRTKIENYLEGVKAATSEYVMAIDAFDTLAIQSCDRTLAAYKSRPRAHLPILFGSELYCIPKSCKEGIREWHVKHLGEKKALNAERKIIQHDGYKKSSVQFFLNSGCILGPLADMQQFITKMSESGIEDDQIAAGQVFLAHLGMVDLDLEEKVFRNKQSEPHEKLSDEGTDKGPCVIHFPGMRSDEQQAEILTLYSKYP